ncbi:cytochrome b5-like heme/steroid binding domain-containing protein [Aspergillus affinis]|uniref:cytochrome b5-like heme/steroid binding domain-containing protein n=1 Tax=Aspergillus affinis TaxID=1070780 RepID=UPI0022FF0A3B|nr:uncharacterized protein KD926_008980 [Aspergillus affinis]KAI9039879.1 hypothetical protein KD926_008980 [Aspergillus affinis]
MSWLALRSRLQESATVTPVSTEVANHKGSTEHVEHVEHVKHIAPPNRFQHAQKFDNKLSGSKFSFQDLSIAEDALPFIPPTVVKDQRSLLSQGQGRAWTVVNNIVYDCTDFIQQHPGGDTVIRSFVGEDCSWQFWRFHSKEIMDQWGRPLRVGRTEGAENRFSEPPRFFGRRGSHK